MKRITTLFLFAIMAFVALPQITFAETHHSDIIFVSDVVCEAELEVCDEISISTQTNQSDMSLIEASIEKIKQDKLHIRRTTLSSIDQAFLDETVKAAEAENIEVEAGIKKLATKVEKKAPVEADPVPTEANTKAEIQAYMDKHEIAYESDNNKATLLSLIAAAQTP